MARSPSCQARRAAASFGAASAESVETAGLVGDGESAAVGLLVVRAVGARPVAVTETVVGADVGAAVSAVGAVVCSAVLAADGAGTLVAAGVVAPGIGGMPFGPQAESARIVNASAACRQRNRRG